MRGAFASIGRSALVAGTVIASVALALGPASASAGAVEAQQSPSGFSLPSSNGYQLSALARRPSLGAPSEVILSVSRQDSTAVYVAGGKVTPTSFEADFGALGQIAVTYRETGGRQTIVPDCAPTFSYPNGVYEGTIEFHGEGGYTDVSATSAPGLATGAGCEIVSESSGPRTVGAKLAVSSGIGESGFIFTAHKNGPRKRASFEAQALESNGDVAIIRSVRVSGPPTSFTFSPSFDRAKALPPAPFSGSGAYTRGGPSRKRWNGSLSVDFPGRPGYSLTASPTRAYLERVSVTEKVSHSS